ncbi:hypothetical protein [Nocardia sp. NPDC005825]
MVEGYEIFSEVHDEGFECRKVQKFRDGRTECAGGFVRTDHTWLNDDLDLATLSADPNARAAEITSPRRSSKRNGLLATAGNRPIATAG